MIGHSTAVDRETPPAGLFARRVAPVRALAEDADKLVRASRDLAGRFAAGGTLLVFGNGVAATDAAHVAVEFVHPAIVGKRAVPSVSLANDPTTLRGYASPGGNRGFADQLRCWARPSDIALGVSVDGRCPDVLDGLRAAVDMGLLAVALVGGAMVGDDGGPIAAEPGLAHLFSVLSDDPQVVKEAHVTIYHLLWELTQLFLEQPAGPGSGGSTGAGLAGAVRS